MFEHGLKGNVIFAESKKLCMYTFKAKKKKRNRIHCLDLKLMLIYITARSEPICNIGCTKRKTNKDSNIHEIGFGSTLIMVDDNCQIKV